MPLRVEQLLVGGLYLVVSACVGSEAPSRSANATASARAFTDWYFVSRDSGGAGGSIAYAVQTRPEFFDSALLAALRADLAASAASPGEIVGLDFDPVTASQDPCERYEPQPARPNGADMSVALAEVCNQTQARMFPVTIEMREAGSKWLIANFVYSDSSHLQDILKRLAADRDSTPARPTA